MAVAERPLASIDLGIAHNMVNYFQDEQRITVTEWGVRFTGPQGSHITECKDEEEARRIAAGRTQPGCTMTIVTRRVILEKWTERT